MFGAFPSSSSSSAVGQQGTPSELDDGSFDEERAARTAAGATDHGLEKAQLVLSAETAGTVDIEDA
ncbi:MAG: hypothetical protein KF729_39055 [Sandaracinaceae bacterium]|nr:hypothetical protein [Sandaracinaceae bacterium]